MYNLFSTVTIFISVISLIGLVNPVNISVESLGETKSSLKSSIEDRKEGRCNLVTKNIDTKIAKFNNNKQRHVDRYQKIKSKTEDLILKLKSKQADTAKLETDLKTLDEKIKKFAGDYSIFISTLEATKAFDCGNSDGNFVKSLDESKAKLKIVREDSSDIRNFIQTVIRPEIQTIKTQLTK